MKETKRKKNNHNQNKHYYWLSLSWCYAIYILFFWFFLHLFALSLFSFLFLHAVFLSIYLFKTTKISFSVFILILWNSFGIAENLLNFSSSSFISGICLFLHFVLFVFALVCVFHVLKLCYLLSHHWPETKSERFNLKFT